MGIYTGRRGYLQCYRGISSGHDTSNKTPQYCDHDCQGEGGNVCAIFSMHFFAQTQYTKQLAAVKRENDKENDNFKQNAFAMVTPPRRKNIQVPELTGATLGNTPVGVKYQQYP